MKILVCVKAVPDPGPVIGPCDRGLEIRVDHDADMRMNRFDAFAVEEAVLIRQALPGTFVEAATVGPEAARKVVRRTMGMGADAGIHIQADYAGSCDATLVSSYIAAVAREKNYDLILCGVMSEDMMQFAVGPMIAGRLSLAWATSVIEATLNPADRKIHVLRELEGGVRTNLNIRLPALVTVQSGINEPRYPSLSNLLRATDARIQIIASETLPSPAAACRTLSYAYPEKKRTGRVLTGSPREKAEELARILGEKGIRLKAEGDSKKP